MMLTARTAGEAKLPHAVEAVMLFDDFLAYLKRNHGQAWVDRWYNFTWPLMLD